MEYFSFCEHKKCLLKRSISPLSDGPFPTSLSHRHFLAFFPALFFTLALPTTPYDIVPFIDFLLFSLMECKLHETRFLWCCSPMFPQSLEQCPTQSKLFILICRRNESTTMSTTRKDSASHLNCWDPVKFLQKIWSRITNPTSLFQRVVICPVPQCLLDSHGGKKKKFFFSFFSP